MPPNSEIPDEFEGLPTDLAIDLDGALIKRWTELLLEELARDIAKLNTLDVLNQAFIRAKWSKHADLIMATSDAMEKYNTLAGRLDLLAQVYGDQLGLPAHSLQGDIAARLDWYKKRLVVEFERTVKRDLNTHKVVSPIEQIFLLEWRFLKADERYGVKIQPQRKLNIEGVDYTIDFLVQSADKRLKLGIELDGHEFHERTKEQAARDKARERKIVRQGYTILRFTGSEVFRNPRKCVNEVLDFLTSPPSCDA
jgi:very-short-patch-repair endonuclease